MSALISALPPITLVMGVLAAAIGLDTVRRSRRNLKRVKELVASLRRDREALKQSITGLDEDVRSSTDGHIRDGACYCLCRKCTVPAEGLNGVGKCICDFCNQDCPSDKLRPEFERSGRVDLFMPVDTHHHERPVWKE